MRVRERIVTSQLSDDLSESVEGVADIDIIRACGAVAAGNALGVSLWRLKYTQAGSELGFAVEGLAGLLVRAGKANEEQAIQVVYNVLRHALNDVCEPCAGRGFKTVLGTPMLSDEQCPHCAGQGRRPMPDATEAAVWLVEQIARLEREVAGAITRKLATEFDLG